jgi:hypothetical protein
MPGFAKCVLESGDSRFESTPDTFFLAYRGSVAHGMFIPSTDPKSIDDIDLMGFAFGDTNHYLGLQEWGSRGTREIKPGCYDVVLYEIRKAVALLLQGNPSGLSRIGICFTASISTMLSLGTRINNSRRWRRGIQRSFASISR